MGLEHKEINSFADNRLAFLTKAFSTGIRVVFGRHGERILEGVILRIEGKYAIIQYKHLGKILEDKVTLEKLSIFNPTIAMTSRKTEKVN